MIEAAKFSSYSTKEMKEEMRETCVIDVMGVGGVLSHKKTGGELYEKIEKVLAAFWRYGTRSKNVSCDRDIEDIFSKVFPTKITEPLPAELSKIEEVDGEEGPARVLTECSVKREDLRSNRGRRGCEGHGLSPKGIAMIAHESSEAQTGIASESRNRNRTETCDRSRFLIPFALVLTMVIMTVIFLARDT